MLNGVRIVVGLVGLLMFIFCNASAFFQGMHPQARTESHGRTMIFAGLGLAMFLFSILVAIN